MKSHGTAALDLAGGVRRPLGRRDHRHSRLYRGGAGNPRATGQRPRERRPRRRHVDPAITDDQRALLLRDEYPFPVSVGWLLRHLLHDLQHHVLYIPRGTARLALADLPEAYTVRREKPL
jgi:hypothetical protein